MTETAIFGGSFDPVHLGHLFLLHCVVSLTDYKKIIVVPAALSNFKQNSRPVASTSQRFEMLSLALEDFRELYPSDKDADITVSDFEIINGGVSYTYDTVNAIKKKLNITDRIGFVIGDDHVKALRNWYRYDELKKEVEFIICPRNNDEKIWESLDEDLHFVRLKTERIAEENSSEIRSDSNGKINYLSERVKAYVRAENLYL